MDLEVASGGKQRRKVWICVVDARGADDPVAAPAVPPLEELLAGMLPGARDQQLELDRPQPTLAAVQLNADPHSLQVREGLRGVKPLTDKDRADIRKTIDEKILGGRPIVFRSTAVEPGNGALTVRGELELAGTTRPASFELTASADGRVRGTLPVTQSEWGIKPYRGMMGALKVRDTSEVILDVPLPSD